jgi:hypothetical protein
MNSLGVRWPDAQLVGFCVNYDNVELRLVEPGGGRVVVRARGHIGLTMPGFWDELVVESGGVHPSSSFQADVEATAQRVSSNYRDKSGCATRNGGRFRTLSIVFIDGCTLQVVAAEFDVNRYLDGAD